MSLPTMLLWYALSLLWASAVYGQYVDGDDYGGEGWADNSTPEPDTTTPEPDTTILTVTQTPAATTVGRTAAITSRTTTTTTTHTLTTATMAPKCVFDCRSHFCGDNSTPAIVIHSFYSTSPESWVRKRISTRVVNRTTLDLSRRKITSIAVNGLSCYGSDSMANASNISKWRSTLLSAY
jgi:hypothetical protein